MPGGPQQSYIHVYGDDLTASSKRFKENPMFFNSYKNHGGTAANNGKHGYFENNLPYLCYSFYLHIEDALAGLALLLLRKLVCHV